MSNFSSILDKTSNHKLIEIRDYLVSKIKTEVNSFKAELSDLHHHVDVNEINDLRLKLFGDLNSDLPWEDMILEICGDEIKIKHGSDLLIQNKINLSIQMPNDHTSVLPIHTDSSSADSPFQTNIWIPLTDAFDTNSMFILDKDQTVEFIQNVASKKNQRISCGKF